MRQRELIYKHLTLPKSLLIVLDACRYDVFIDNLGLLDGFRLRVFRTYSSGSCTRDWLLNTFTRPVNVVYVTANPWVPLLFKSSGVFKAIADVSARFWDEELGTVRAEHVNLVALKYLVRGEKLIVHYLQPHAPFITSTWLKDNTSSRELAGSRIYKLAARSKAAREEFRRAYIENLRYVLKHVRRLVYSALKLGYRVVITSDHSELLGVYAPLKMFRLFFRKNLLKFLRNWLPYAIGYYRVVGHPCGWRGRELYEVPWVEMMANERNQETREWN